MLAINLVKENDMLFNITPIKHALIYWKFLNKSGYLEHFIYNKDLNEIIFDASVSQNIYCFKLMHPIAEGEYFYLSSLNQEPDEAQLNIIETYNTKALEYDYTNFLNFSKQPMILEYSTVECILADSLNIINDACLANDESDSDSDSEYAKYANHLNKTITEGHNIVPDILHNPTDSDDTYEPFNLNLKDDFIDDDEIDPKLIIKETIDRINVLRMRDKIDLRKEIGMTDIDRIMLIMNMVNKMDKVMSCCNYIQYTNNNAFELEIPLINFKMLPDITMYMKFNCLTFPYCSVAISFNTIFENNLGYIINYLVKNCINWLEMNDIQSEDISIGQYTYATERSNLPAQPCPDKISLPEVAMARRQNLPIINIVNQIHDIINQHGSIENYTSSEVELINALNIFSIHTRILPTNYDEFSEYFRIISINHPTQEAPLSDDISLALSNIYITDGALYCNKLMKNGKHTGIIKNSCVIPMMAQLLNDVDFENAFNADIDLINSMCDVLSLFITVVTMYPVLITPQLHQIIKKLTNDYYIYNKKEHETNNPRLQSIFNKLVLAYNVLNNLDNNVLYE
jgi:hypothetical protein